jgi:hypothetical protein
MIFGKYLLHGLRTAISVYIFIYTYIYARDFP